MPADPNRVRDVFLAAVELPPEQRPAYLAEACGGDADLRAEVDRLLAANADPDSILEPPPPTTADATAAFVASHPGTVELPGRTRAAAAFDPDAPQPTQMATAACGTDGGTATFDQPDPDAATAAEPGVPAPRAARVPTDEGIGTVIAGRYRLVEVIGEGGMGSVYLASQTEPVKRQVALKLIKTGMDSRGVLARFDAERQALALMDHPNIARIYDGGLTPAGQPFFVMELVKGVPLTQYCDQQRLTVKARLELFVAVCQAVQHAHQKGIIHRDLKPGNVLVTEVDGRPTPKVIDFGVAKATEQNLTEMSFSDTGAIVGTPTYMSPEQADPSSMDIDTRTDIYALGVMLYELLTGSPPLEAKDFRRGAILEMLRMVREVDPPRPSTKLSTAEALPNIAANRSIEPARLAKLLHGELDWVVMKALEKDRTRRFETANGFARDIQRYLADEVVEARPPSRGYRLKKFVKRNKIQVIAASLVFLTLVGGIVGTSFGMLAAQRAQKAEAVQRAKADDQRDKAVAAEARTRTIDEFLTKDLLTQAEPANNAVEDKVTLLEVLDRAAGKVGTRFTDQPGLEEYLRWTIANVYHSLASWDKAESQTRSLLDSARKRDPRSAESYKYQGFLAHILWHRGRTDSEVLEMAETAVKGLERTLGPDDPDTQSAINNLALAYEATGRLPEAIALLERVRDVSIAKLGPDHVNTLTVLANLAAFYKKANQLEKSVPLFEDVVKRQEATLGREHPNTQMTRSNLGFIYFVLNRPKEAIPLLEEVYRASKKHPEFRGIAPVLIDAYRKAGQAKQALPLLEEKLAATKANLGPDDPETLSVLQVLATTYREANQPDKSVPLFEDVLKRREAKFGRQDLATQRTVATLGVAYKDVGRLKEAIQLLEEAHQAAKRFPELRWVDGPLIDAYQKAGENAKLADLLQEQLAEARKTRPKDSSELGGMLAQIGLSLLQQKKWTEAEPLLRECLAIREKTQPVVWSTFNTQSLLGGALLGQKKFAEAEPLLLKGYEGMKQREKTIPPQAGTRIPEALDRLIELSTATNKPDDVKKWQAERAKYLAAAPTPGEKK
jgi:eukaryotic-like serine/threonine-protein kinase